ncbi:hypothetical protein NP233_g12897 [Leucocoprinus birnbaumii]|uniref:Uncharacterized protein n=1 Tax=Leucocoprinus birnbaumii TaxID=56174 RepID=A0AAD5YMM6_9AGAR|nr:hypothetical protein NP233_g12897 [Leucocoprinus birnbaumii]
MAEPQSSEGAEFADTMPNLKASGSARVSIESNTPAGSNTTYQGVFDSFSSPSPARGSQFFEFSLPPPQFRDDVSEKSIAPSILGTQHPTPSLTVLGIPKEAPAKPSSEMDDRDEIRDGKLREAPTVLVAEKALKDLNELLRGKSRGKCGGYIPPNFNPFITTQKLANFLSQPDVKERHGIDIDIHVTTARRYLKALNFRFSCPPKGQYADVKALEPQMWKFDPDIDPITSLPITPFCPVVPWSHNESVFYAHDHRHSNWYHKEAPAVPYAKGDGLSFMVARAVLPDYGWLEPKPGHEIFRKDGTKITAHRTLKPGKNRDGYFTSEGVLDQFQDMVAIVKSSYPDDDHVFFYDNAPSHLKHSPGALSARKMPMKTPKEGTNWLVNVPELGSDNKPIKDPITGAVKTKKVHMADAKFRDGTPQSLYFPEGHP